jgi:hypothetical protein
VSPEDVVDVLRKMVEAVEPGGLVLDLQVIRPNPVVEACDRVLCEIDGERLFVIADAATAAVEAAIAAGRLVEEAIDDHDVRKHYADGADVVDDFAGKKRKLPPNAVPRLRTGLAAVRRARAMPTAAASRPLIPAAATRGVVLLCACGVPISGPSGRT